MRFDDIDPDERDDRPRRRYWIWLLGIGALVLSAVVITLVVRRDSPAVESAPTEPATVPDTEPPLPEVPFVPPQLGPNDFPDFGSDYQGDKLELLTQRTTADGIAVTVQKIDWGAGNFGGIVIGDGPPRAVEGVATPDTAVAVETTAAATNGGDPVGWVPAPWCNPTSGFRVTMTHDTSIGTGQGQLFDGVADDAMATMFTSGYAEGHPFRVLIVQVSNAVKLVTVHFPDGASDQSTAENGIVILGSMGKRPARFTLTLTVDGVERTVASTDLVQQGNLAWQQGCTPPPPVLPPPGEQPADPAAAETLIRSRFEVLFDQMTDQENKPADLIDDRTGVDDALAAVASGPFAEAAKTAQYEMADLVFTSPTEAWFKYAISTSNGVFSDRFGVVRLIDGSWRFVRAVVCQDLALAATPCEPPVDNIQPPAATGG